MKVVVVSGKGGTGKTTITSSFWALSPSKVLAVDCDVDASNLHLMHPGIVQEAYAFKGAKVAKIESDLCIGCSVIASMTATDVCLVVTEPTQSGLADLKRVLSRVTHFDTRAYVIIDKYDVNVVITETINKMCLSEGVEVIGQIPYDGLVKESINQGLPIVGFEESLGGQAIKASYILLEERIGI